MSRQWILRLFYGGLVAVAAAALLTAGAAVVAAVADPFVQRGPDVVGVRASAGGWAALGLLAGALLLLLAAAAAELAAWVGALVETAQRPDKILFVVLLVTGLLSAGVIGMIVYALTGPAEPAPPPGRDVRPAGPPALVP
jgi:hypothetical protein